MTAASLTASRHRVTDRPPVGASIDLGSNSVHLLVAAIAGHRLRPLVDESAFLGLGATIDQQAHLGGDGTARLVDQLATYVDTAHRLGATSIALLGTEPIRRAADAAAVAFAIEQRTGIPLHVLTHEEEAYLTVVGVTQGRPVTHETLVLDIGGGSSEFCAVGPGGRARAAGLRIGSNRLTGRVGAADPPTARDIAAMGVIADEALQDALDARPDEIVAVGGTATNLLKVTSGGTLDRILTRERLAEALRNLALAPAAEITERYVVNPTRARLLPAGAVLVDAVLRRYGVDRLTVSEAGLREGAIFVVDHAGPAWRDRLPELAHGWRA